MKVRVGPIRVAITLFVVLAVLANLPQLESLVRPILGEGTGLRVAAIATGLTFLVLALYIWVMAIQHLRSNMSLTGGHRMLWTVIVYGTFVFGAIVYHLRFLRTSQTLRRM